MSIATLKKKTQTQYSHHMSVGKAGFSLNGTHRNQGYIGQTSLSRSLPRTLSKGATIKGHGGCCGTYPIFPPVLSAVNSTEDSSVVKKSVLNTKGMMDTKYRWVRRPQPFSRVGTKQVDNSDYINYIKQKTITECEHIISEDCNVFCDNVKNIVSKKARQTITKPDNGAVSHEEYIQQLKSKCTEFDEYNFFSPKTSNNGIAFGTCS